MTATDGAPILRPMLTLSEWRGLGSRRQVRNRKLFVIDTGPAADAAPLVLIHGYPTSAWDFAPLLPSLTGRRVIAFDLLGYGLSEKPWPHQYSLPEQTDFVAALVKGLKIERAHLVAHDMGDTVVQELLARRLDDEHQVPFAIASVTLLNGGVLVGSTRPVVAQRLLRTPLGQALGPYLPERLARATFEKSLRHIAGPRRPPPPEELRTQFELIEHEGGRRLLPHLIGYMRERETHRKRWRRALMTHPLPMRLVWGDRDPINPWSAVEEIVRERSATEAVRIAGAGHYPQLEAPEEVGKAIMEFVRRVDGAGQAG